MTALKVSPFRSPADLDLVEMFTALAAAAEALRPFAKRANFLPADGDPTLTHWHPAVGSPIAAGDLLRAGEVLAIIDTLLSAPLTRRDQDHSTDSTS